MLAGSITDASAQLRTRTHASAFTQPIAIVQDPIDASVQFVVEQRGRIRVLRNGSVQAADFPRHHLSRAFGRRAGAARARLPTGSGLTGRFYVDFTNAAGDTVVARFHRSATPLVADPLSRFDLRWNGAGAAAVIPQPFANHNGGHLAFGPDGYLYVGMGDGGSGDDPNHFAQDPSSLLGKMLRVHVGVPDSHPIGYVIPGDNPFAAGTARREIWSFGLRNPWRYTFDDPARGGTGAMIVADVGQDRWEEVDYEPLGRGGRNYGWRNREGAHDNVTSRPPAFSPLVDPIYEYDHSTGSSITGGYVYRGASLGAAFRGRYFFADFARSRVWSMALTVDEAGNARASDLRERTTELGGASQLAGVSSFGIDAGGELYIVSYNRGVVMKIVGPPGTPGTLRIIR